MFKNIVAHIIGICLGIAITVAYFGRFQGGAGGVMGEGGNGSGSAVGTKAPASPGQLGNPKPLKSPRQHIPHAGKPFRPNER